jgi:hypothetical protein
VTISEPIGWNHRRVIQLPCDLHSIHIDIRCVYLILSLFPTISIAIPLAANSLCALAENASSPGHGEAASMSTVQHAAMTLKDGYLLDEEGWVAFVGGNSELMFAPAKELLLFSCVTMSITSETISGLMASQHPDKSESITPKHS